MVHDTTDSSAANFRGKVWRKAVRAILLWSRSPSLLPRSYFAVQSERVMPVRPIPQGRYR